MSYQTQGHEIPGHAEMRDADVAALRQALADARSTIAAQASTIAELRQVIGAGVDRDVKYRAEMILRDQQIEYREQTIALLMSAMGLPEIDRLTSTVCEHGIHRTRACGFCVMAASGTPADARIAHTISVCGECRALPHEAHYDWCCYRVEGEVQS